jgi:pimeloyl-ACP methyl ester carboxylesterase
MHQAYGEVSPDGIGHYPVVLAKMAQAHLVEPTLGPADLARINCRTLVMLGDDDEVRLEHAIEMYRALPRGELAVVPGGLPWAAGREAGAVQPDHPRLPPARPRPHPRPHPPLLNGQCRQGGSSCR